jgi:sigma-54 dependent transcriptional regulator, acetoin dehydrogenase operon transcriptional activator AcoR
LIRPQKTLLIFSLDKNICRFLYRMVHDVIGHEVQIHCLSSGEILTQDINPDLIMLSNEGVREEVTKLFPKTPILLPKRIITCFNLEKLLRLPTGHKVLLANDPRVATEDTIESLVNFGVSHVNYIPYWVGRNVDLAGIETAVSPGMTHLVPKKIKNVIDIGPRTISTHSFLHLLDALELDFKYLEKFANSYHNLLIEYSRKLTAALDRSEVWRSHMEVILDEFEDGLILVNENGRINRANSSVENQLSLSRKHLINKNIDRLFANFEKLADLAEDVQQESKSSGIYSFNKRKFLINKIPVTGSKLKSHIFTFREIERIQKIEENVRIKLSEKGYVTKYDFSDVWSQSPKIESLLDKVVIFAKSALNILITGESGTGKELIAHVIHKSSERRDGPFVAVNFAGLSESLIESELFGYEEGAFTGAKRGGKMGLFEQAHGGTIFLDEIGDAPLPLQSRLLRVLQEKEVMRVGGSRIVPVNVRVIAATNKNLIDSIAEKQFREDLFYRINSLQLVIPPLRERKGDVLFILNRYLERKYKITKQISKEAADCLTSYHWPGNVRELINTAEYICFVSRGKPDIDPDHLPDTVRNHFRESLAEQHLEEKSTFNRLTEELLFHNYTIEMTGLFLTFLKQREGKVNGRNTMKKEMMKHNYIFTDGTMKSFMKTLRNAGLVRVGRTKQGTSITTEGKQFLAHLQFRN